MSIQVSREEGTKTRYHETWRFSGPKPHKLNPRKRHYAAAASASAAGAYRLCEGVTSRQHLPGFRRRRRRRRLPLISMDWSSLRRPDSMDKLVADQPPLLEYGVVQAMFVGVPSLPIHLRSSYPASEFRLGVGHQSCQCACRRAGEKKQQNMQSLNRGKKGIFSRREQIRCSLQKLICPL